jgi:hypothetical protein
MLEVAMIFDWAQSIAHLLIIVNGTKDPVRERPGKIAAASVRYLWDQFRWSLVPN